MNRLEALNILTTLNGSGEIAAALNLYDEYRDLAMAAVSALTEDGWNERVDATPKAFAEWWNCVDGSALCPDDESPMTASGIYVPDPSRAAEIFNPTPSGGTHYTPPSCCACGGTFESGCRCWSGFSPDCLNCEA